MQHLLLLLHLQHSCEILPLSYKLVVQMLCASRWPFVCQSWHDNGVVFNPAVGALAAPSWSVLAVKLLRGQGSSSRYSSGGSVHTGYTQHSRCVQSCAAWSFDCWLVIFHTKFGLLESVVQSIHSCDVD